MTLTDELLEAYGQKQLDQYTHWVYVLYCRNSYRTYEDIKRKANNRLDRIPDWLRESFEANRLYYVGQTENLQKRLGQHFEQQNSSEFTTLYPPTGIDRLIPENSRNSAIYTERAQAKAINQSDKDYFVFQH